jgi:hypothetical protein
MCIFQFATPSRTGLPHFHHGAKYLAASKVAPIRTATTAASHCFAYATALNPFLATSASSFNEAPRGCFSPRSH